MMAEIFKLFLHGSNVWKSAIFLLCVFVLAPNIADRWHCTASKSNTAGNNTAIFKAKRFFGDSTAPSIGGN